MKTDWNTTAIKCSYYCLVESGTLVMNFLGNSLAEILNFCSFQIEAIFLQELAHSWINLLDSLAVMFSHVSMLQPMKSVWKWLAPILVLAHKALPPVLLCASYRRHRKQTVEYGRAYIKLDHWQLFHLSSIIRKQKCHPCGTHLWYQPMLTNTQPWIKF